MGHSVSLILIVDDNVEISEFVADALTERGYRVLCAVNGASLDIALHEQPALILLDLLMPAMDGREVARRLRADPATAAIPLVVCSAQATYHGTRPDMPCDGWLDKPFDLGDLYAVVAHHAPLVR